LPGDGLPPNVPSDDHYDIMYSTGGGLFAGTNIGRQATGMFTDWLFTADRWVVHVALSLIHWSLSFHIADALTAPAAKLAAAYQTQVVDRLGLIGFFLFVAVAWAGWHVLRSRTSKGVGEFAVTLLILAVTTAAWAAPATFLLGPNGLLGHTRDVAAGLADITATGTSPAPPPGCPGGPYGPPAPGTNCNAPPTGDTTLAPLLESMHHAFVEVPYQLLNWGAQLDTPGANSACLAAEAKIVAGGPWSTSDTPRNTMSSAGGTCSALAKFNATPTPDRLVGAALSLFGSLLVMILAIVMSIALIFAELTCVGLVVAFPLVSAVSLMPGPGRQLLWRWISHMFAALFALIATVVSLALMLVGIDALLSALGGQALLVILVVLNGMVVAGLVMHRRLRKGFSRAAQRIGRRLENANVGGAGTSGWLRPAAEGFGAAELLDEHRRLRHRMNQGTHALHRARRLGDEGQRVADRARGGGRNSGDGGGSGATGDQSGSSSSGAGSGGWGRRAASAAASVVPLSRLPRAARAAKTARAATRRTKTAPAAGQPAAATPASATASQRQRGPARGPGRSGPAGRPAGSSAAERPAAPGGTGRMGETDARAAAVRTVLAAARRAQPTATTGGRPGPKGSGSPR
jgi:hypothetical protein